MSRIKKVSIYDMDGTIVDSSHRYRTKFVDNTEKIDLQFWRDNQHKALEDSLLPLYNQYRLDLSDENCYVIIATARVINQLDQLFINDTLGSPDYLISRKPDDTQSGKTLKIGGLAKFFNLINFSNAEFTFYEDNMEYLKAVCDRFNIKGVYIPSNQGH